MPLVGTGKESKPSLLPFSPLEKNSLRDPPSIPTYLTATAQAPERMSVGWDIFDADMSACRCHLFRLSLGF